MGTTKKGTTGSKSDSLFTPGQWFALAFPFLCLGIIALLSSSCTYTTQNFNITVPGCGAEGRAAALSLPFVNYSTSFPVTGAATLTNDSIIINNSVDASRKVIQKANPEVTTGDNTIPASVIP